MAKINRDIYDVREYGFGAARNTLELVLSSDPFANAFVTDADERDAVLNGQSPQAVREAVTRILRRAVKLPFFKEEDGEYLVIAAQNYISEKFSMAQ